VDIAGITTAATLKVGTGVTVSSDGDIFATGVTTSTTFSGNFSGGTISGTTGTFSGSISADGGIDASSQTVTVNKLNLSDVIEHGSDTDTKIRFPADDTVSVETAGSEKLRIASNGNITYSAASGENTIISKRTNSAGSNGNYFFHLNANNSDDNTVGSFGFHRDTATDDSRIVFSTRTSGGSNTERLRINSSGDLLYASSARNYACWYKSPTNSSSNAATSNSEVLVYGTAVIANTDVYNTSNGRYTAPVDGLYYIRANGLIDNNAAQAGMQLKLYKNGSEYGTQIGYNTYLSEDSPNRYKLLSGTGIMYMDTGDYAQIWATSGMHTSNETNLIVYLIRGTI